MITSVSTAVYSTLRIPHKTQSPLQSHLCIYCIFFPDCDLMVKNVHLSLSHIFFLGFSFGFECGKEGDKRKLKGNIQKLHFTNWSVSACAYMLSHSVVSNSLRPHGLQPARLLCPWNSPGKSTGWAAVPSSRGSSQPMQVASPATPALPAGSLSLSHPGSRKRAQQIYILNYNGVNSITN